MKANTRVMLVDDEAGVRDSWDRFLTGRGYEVTTAVDGESAISELRRNPADIVISDLRMPTVDGLQLLEWVHDEQPETPFVLVTGYGDASVEDRAKELGAFDFLNKPIGPDTLANVITAALHLGLLEGEEKIQGEVAAATPEAAAAVLDEATEVERELATLLEAVEVEEQSRGGVLGALETVGGLIAAPILGLAFVIFLPVIGVGALFWVMGETVWGAIARAE